MHANNGLPDIILDSAIAGAAAGLAVLAATQGLPTIEGGYAALLAFSGAFVASFAAARGRKHGGGD